MNPRSVGFLASLVCILVLTGCGKNARRAQLLAQADSDFAAGRWDTAEVEYHKVLLSPPVSAPAIIQLGLIYEQQGRLREAYSYLREAAKRAPDRIDVQAALGRVYLQGGKPDDARTAAKDILKRDPSNEGALDLLADSSRTKELFEDSRRLIQDLRAHHPDCSGYHLVLGVLDGNQGDLPGAETEFNKAVALNPKSADAYLELGNLYAYRRELDKARTAFATAAALSPVRSPSAIGNIEFLLRSGKTADAKQALAEVIDKAPDFMPALDISLRIALAEKRYPDAQKSIQDILSRDPRNYDALVARATVKNGQGDTPGAIAEFEKAEDVFPRSPQIKYDLAAAYLSRGDLNRAGDRLNQALVVAPAYEPAALLLAEVRLRQGNTSAAVPALIEWVKRDPKNARIYELLAQAFIGQKDTNQALAVYRGMEAALPKDPRGAYLEGLLLARQNQPESGRPALERALRVDPNFGPAIEALVNLDLSEKHLDAAAGRVRAVIERAPNMAGPRLLQARVDIARGDKAAAEADLLKAVEVDPKSQAVYLQLADFYLANHQTKLALEKLSSLADSTGNKTALMQLGAIHERLGEYQTAGADYQKLLSIDPKFMPALNNLAVLDAEHLAKQDEALDLAKGACAIAPEDFHAKDTLGWIYFERGALSDALGPLQQAAQLGPDDPEVAYHLGLLHYRLGEESPARLDLERVAAAPGAIPAHAADARRRLALLDLDASGLGSAQIASLQAASAADPHDPVALSRLGVAQAHSGNSAEAQKSLSAALQLAPQDAAATLELAQLYSGPLRDFAQARSLAKSAHELAPDDPAISRTLGRIAYKTGDYRWSLDLLEEAARGLPGDPGLQYDLSIAECGAGQLEDAADGLRQLLQSGASFPERSSAEALAKMIAAVQDPGLAPGSAALAGTVLASDPQCFPAAMTAALAQEKNGDPAGAAQACEKILAEDPLFNPAWRELALLYAKRTGVDQRSYDVAKKARELFSDDPSVVSAAGIIYYRHGDYDAAAQLFESSLRQRAQDAETEFYLGMTDYSRKRPIQAKTELSRALEFNLPQREADDAKRILEEMKTDASGETKPESDTPEPPGAPST